MASNSSGKASNRSRSSSPASAHLRAKRGVLSGDEYNKYVNKAFNNAESDAISRLEAFSDDWYDAALRFADIAIFGNRSDKDVDPKTPEKATSFPSHLPSSVSVRRKAKASAKRKSITPPKRISKSVSPPGSATRGKLSFVSKSLKSSSEVLEAKQYPPAADRSRFGFKPTSSRSSKA